MVRGEGVACRAHVAESPECHHHQLGLSKGLEGMGRVRVRNLFRSVDPGIELGLMVFVRVRVRVRVRTRQASARTSRVCGLLAGFPFASCQGWSEDGDGYLRVAGDCHGLMASRGTAR